MFFVVSKILGYLVLPSNFIAAVGLVGAGLLATRFERWGRRLIVAFIVLFAAFGYLPIGSLLMFELEDRFPLVWDFPGEPPDGIIVLGGAIDPDANLMRKRPVFIGQAERISAAAELAEAFPKARVVFTGGSSRLTGEGTPEADYAVPLLVKLGIPRERIEVEPRARNTHESAVFTKALLEPKPNERWLLVTSATHMPRSVGCFRKVGFPVESYSVDRRAFSPLQQWPSFSPIGSLNVLDLAVREYVGLLMYWLAGYTSELWPKPTEWDRRNWPGRG